MQVQNLYWKYQVAFVMTAGERLKAWRKARGLTQEELAAAVGIGPAYMSNLERDVAPNKRSGQPRASEALCDRLARVLDVPAADVRALYGYAAPRRQAQTVQELLDDLWEIGIHVNLSDNLISDDSPEAFERAKASIEAILRAQFGKL